MDVSLTPELEDFVHSKVRAGRYGSPSEVIQAALQLLEERDQAVEKDDLRRKIAEGVESLRRGEGLDGEAVFADLEQLLTARKEAD